MNKTPYIGFWRRVVAFVIDGLIAAVPPAVLCGPVIYNLGTNMQPEDSEAYLMTLTAMITVYVLWQILGLVSFWLYFALLESGPKQATFGKRIMGIKVVDYKGGRIGFGRATGRTFAKILSYSLLYIGFIMAGTSSRKRALHDFVAQTYVVRKDFEPGDELPDTKSHPVYLCLMIAGGILLMLTWLGFALISSTTATAQNAAARLEELAAGKNLLREPLQENGIEYSRTRAGYRAQFKDWEAENYTLLLRPRANAVCCETAPGGDCRPTGFEACK